MKRFTSLQLSLSLLSGLFVSLAFPTWQGRSAEATVVIPQQQLLDHRESEPAVDIKPGRLATPKGVEIGTIQDFVLDLQAGRMVYTVGVFDHIGELRNRVFILPWEMVDVDLEMRTFTLSEDKTVLQGAPSFALDAWANLPASQWAKIVAAYWQEKLGPDFAAANSPESALSKASDLVGLTIKNLAGEEVGTIAELILDPEIGSIAYAVLSFEDAQKSNHTIFFALPWDLVQVDPAQHTFVADVDRKMFTENQAVAPESFGGDSG